MSTPISVKTQNMDAGSVWPEVELNHKLASTGAYAIT